MRIMLGTITVSTAVLTTTVTSVIGMVPKGYNAVRARIYGSGFGDVNHDKFSNKVGSV